MKVIKENSISKEAFEKMKSKAYKKGHRQGYNKAIDDLMEKVSECFIYDADWRYLVQESERLKEGVNNDKKCENK